MGIRSQTRGGGAVSKVGSEAPEGDGLSVCVRLIHTARHGVSNNHAEALQALYETMARFCIENLISYLWRCGNLLSIKWLDVVNRHAAVGTSDELVSHLRNLYWV